MKSLFKNIVGRIFAVYVAVIFVITLMLAVGPIWLTRFIKEPLGTEIFRKISAIWMRIFLFMIGSPISVKGTKNFAEGETYIVVCNHNSMMDIPTSTPFIPWANKTIAKISMSRIPFFGVIYKRGSILIDRENEESRKKSYAEMKKVLAAGMHMCIYPEGTRNKTDKPLKPFYDGAFKLSIETGKSIIPGIIFNTKKVLPIHKSFYVMPHPLAIHFLPPISPNGKSVQELKEEVYKIMEDYYVSNS